jgi:hypothetical protein
MRANGFTVVVQDHADMRPVRRDLGVPDNMQSCHTGKIGTYLVEGHIPAADVIRLLREKPEGLGIAAPGMPSGSPGMENGMKDAYDVILFEKDGRTRVYSKHH